MTLKRYDMEYYGVMASAKLSIDASPETVANTWSKLKNAIMEKTGASDIEVTVHGRRSTIPVVLRKTYDN